jgi:hypothetical protein
MWQERTGKKPEQKYFKRRKEAEQFLSNMLQPTQTFFSPFKS